MSAPRTQAVADSLVVPAGTTAGDAVAAAGLPANGPKAIVVVRDPGGRLRDLDWVPELDTDVVPVAMDEPDGLNVLRHSAAHVLAQAVQDIFPEAKLGIGPPIENGFYYDFDVETPFVPEDLDKIETRMRKIIKEGQRFSRRVTTDADAINELQEEPYKIELIGLKGSGKSDDAAEGASVEVGGSELTIYDNIRRDGEVAWSDLCRGPHLPTTKRIPAFKLMRSAAAYWRGSEENKQLQRIYGTAWESMRRSRNTCTGSRRRSAATTAGSAATSTCSASPTRSAPAWRSSTPRAV